MSAPSGNKFWEARSSHGRKRKWEDPEQLLDACTQYFEWVESNPLWETKPFNNQGEIVEAPIAKMRAMTIGGLCVFLGMDRRSWCNYRDLDDFFPIIVAVEEIIREQKFTGAAAGLLSANIIARDLGLSESQKVEHSGSLDTLSDEQLDAKLKELIDETIGSK